MARVKNNNGFLISGKLNKKSKEVHRVVNGREHVYTIENEYEGPPSEAQKAHRSIFGKTNAIVNTLMADPEQVKIWRERMNDPNGSVRAYAYAVISKEMESKPAARRRRAKLPIRLPKGIKLHINTFADLTAAELYEILKARFNVFVMEQHIRYLDEDNIDYLATHFSIRRKGLVIAYARLFPDQEEGVLRIGRMLTTERNKGFGKYLIHKIISAALEKNARILRLHAQVQVVPFYERLGFHTVGEVFTEADIPHVTMELEL